MLSWIREKFGTVVVSGIIGTIALVFIFYGVFNPKATRGLHEGAVAATVNGEPISIGEFNREVSRRVEYFRALTGGKLTEEQLQGFRIKEAVLRDLVSRKLVIQEAERRGIGASEEHLKDQIRRMAAFQTDGKFDVIKYKQVLEANRHSPGGFEKLVSDDLATQLWQRYFADRTRVSMEEARHLFVAMNDKRSLKWVLLTPESVRKAVSVGADQVAAFLKDPSKLNLAKTQYESRKESDLNGKTFEQAKDLIARDLLAGERTEEVKKKTEELAALALSKLASDGGTRDKPSSSDAAIGRALQSVGGKVQYGAPLTRLSGGVPGVGETPELIRDAFAKGSLLAKPKRYDLAGRVLIAVLVGSETAKLEDFPAQAERIQASLSQRKQRDLVDQWMRKLGAESKVETNPAVVNEGGGESPG